MSQRALFSPVSLQVYPPLESREGRVGWRVDWRVRGVCRVAGPLILAGAKGTDWLGVGIQAAELAVKAVGDAA